MSEFIVGESVVVKSVGNYSSRTNWNIRKITKITPTGRIRVDGIDTQFQPTGRALGPSYAEILHQTPELIATVKLHRARDSVYRETERMPSILCADKLSLEECERIVGAAKAYRASLADIIEAHKPKDATP